MSNILNTFMNGLGNITNLGQMSGALSLQKGTATRKEDFTDWVKGAASKIISEAKATEIQALDHTVQGGDVTKLAHDVTQLQLTLDVLVPLRDHLVSIVKKFQELQM